MTLAHPKGPALPTNDLAVAPIFTLESERIPRHEPRDAEMLPDVAYQIIHDELMLDGNARMNLATFVTTWMEPQAERLMAECLDKNMIDKDEYPTDRGARDALRQRSQPPLERPDAEQATGCSTTGSSEAAMLGGLALKRRWQKRRAAAGESADRPNLVMGINFQVCWEKLANYWDVEMRLVPMEGERFHLSAKDAVALCDENTIGVVAILGSTFDGTSSPFRRSAQRSTSSRHGAGSTFPYTSTEPPARSSLPSSTRSSSGTFAFHEWPRSTRPATSTGSSTRASAGSSGATRTLCRKT